MTEVQTSPTDWLDHEPNDIRARYYEALSSMDALRAAREPADYEQAVKQLELHLFGEDPLTDSSSSLRGLVVVNQGLLETIARPVLPSESHPASEPDPLTSQPQIERNEKMLLVLATLTAEDTDHIDNRLAELTDWSKRYCDPSTQTPGAILYATRHWFRVNFAKMQPQTL